MSTLDIVKNNIAEAAAAEAQRVWYEMREDEGEMGRERLSEREGKKIRKRGQKERQIEGN